KECEQKCDQRAVADVQKSHSKGEQEDGQQYARRASINQRHKSQFLPALGNLPNARGSVRHKDKPARSQAESECQLHQSIAHDFCSLLGHQSHELQLIVKPECPVSDISPQNEMAQFLFFATTRDFVFPDQFEPDSLLTS